MSIFIWHWPIQIHTHTASAYASVSAFSVVSHHISYIFAVSNSISYNCNHPKMLRKNALETRKEKKAAHSQPSGGMLKVKTKTARGRERDSEKDRQALIKQIKLIHNKKPQLKLVISSSVVAVSLSFDSAVILCDSFIYIWLLFSISIVYVFVCVLIVIFSSIFFLFCFLVFIFKTGN